MSWLNRVRNSIPFLPKRETTENLWHKCRQLRGDDLHQGMGGESLRLPALRPS